ncbi:MAG: cytochrome P450 [Bdellovibrionota bacterium]
MNTSFFDFKKTSNPKTFHDDFSHYVKSFGDVYFWEQGGFHVVTNAEAAKVVLTSTDFSADRGAFFISRMPNMDLRLIGDFFGVVKKMMVMSDDEDHSKRRKIAAQGFEDHILERFTVTVQKTVKALVTEVKDMKDIEFVEKLAKKLPSTVLADLFSIPESDREDFFHSANIMTGFFGGASQYRNEDGIEVNSAALNLKNYFGKLIIERKVNPGQDYVSILLRAQPMSGLTDEELISQLIMMLVAGQVTTTDQINNIMFFLATKPELQEKLRAQPELIGNALEELKRVDPAVTFIFRVARADTMIMNHPVKNGDVIFISTHCINRDLPGDELPHEIIPERRAQHFAYGHGPHYCLGAKLGRLEIRLLFEEILRSVPPFKLDETKVAKRDHYSLSFSGWEALPLTTR